MACHIWQYLGMIEDCLEDFAAYLLKTNGRACSQNLNRTMEMLINKTIDARLFQA